SSGVAWMLRKLTMSAPSSHHRGSKAGQYRAYMGPGIPRRLNALVGMEFARDAHVLRHGCRELAGNLGADCVIATRRIAVEAIDVAQHPGSAFNAHVRRQRRDIQIVARLIALEGKVRLDPQGLRNGRHHECVSGWQDDALDLQRHGADELPDAGFDAAELAKDDLAVGRPVQDEPGVCLKALQYCIEPL